MPQLADESDRHVPAERARQGEIVLRSRGRRILFLAGLVGFVALAVAGALLG